MDYIHIEQRNITINKNDILSILQFQKEDIIYLSGSLIEGSTNKLSKGMGNKLSDIDVFILADDFDKIEKSLLDYDRDQIKTQFKKLHGISIDIEIYSKVVIYDLLEQINNAIFSDDTRIFNVINLPNGLDLYYFTSLIHRFINGVPIYNDDKFDKVRRNFKEENFYKFMTRVSVNKIDVNYEDVVGNIDSGNLEVAVSIARSILMETMKAYIFYNKTSIDRDKWIPLKIKNLAFYDSDALKVYEKFKKLYFEEKLDNDKSLRINAEKIIDFSNEIVSKIGQAGEF